MKKYLSYLVIFLFLLQQCTSKVDNVVEAEREVERIIEEQQNIKPRVVETLLGYRFGMTRQEVKSHTNQLLKDRVVKRDGDTLITYNVPTTNEQIKNNTSLIQFDFYKDKLCRVYINTLNLPTGI